jgi:hypothetical protein
MNSQFKNSNIGSIIYIALISMIAIVLIIISWYMIAGYKLGTYSENTILGNVYVGGLPVNGIDSRVYERIDEWKDDETIVFQLTYQDYVYEFNRNLFYFDLELSKANMIDGETNNLIAMYQSTGTDKQDTINEILALPFLSEVSDNLDVDGLITDILEDASLMKTYSSKSVEDYLIDPSLDMVVLDSVEFDLPEGVDIDELIASIYVVYGDNDIDLNSKELFDIIPMLGVELNDAELSVLGSAMVKLIWETNFNINELHYETYIDYSVYNLSTYPHFGSNVDINKVAQYGFSLYNPNNSNYIFRLEKVDADTASLTLVGLPFVDTITVDVNQTLIPHVTETIDDEDQTQIGHDGMYVVVTRTIEDLDENIISEQDIIIEFYPPLEEYILEAIPE